MVNANNGEHASTAIFWRARVLLLWGLAKKLAFQKRPFDQETATTAKICAEAFDEGKNLQTLQKSWPGLSAKICLYFFYINQDGLM